jgi:hypothetical protein
LLGYGERNDDEGIGDEGKKGAEKGRTRVRELI